MLLKHVPITFYYKVIRTADGFMSLDLLALDKRESSIVLRLGISAGQDGSKQRYQARVSPM